MHNMWKYFKVQQLNDIVELPPKCVTFKCVAAPLLRKESVEVVRASGKDAHWAPPLGGVSGTSSGEETSGKTQD